MYIFPNVISPLFNEFAPLQVCMMMCHSMYDDVISPLFNEFAPLQIIEQGHI
jgi:hypothetical protein